MACTCSMEEGDLVIGLQPIGASDTMSPQEGRESINRSEREEALGRRETVGSKG